MHLLKFYEIIQFFDRRLKDFFLFALQAPEGRNLLQNMLGKHKSNQPMLRKTFEYIAYYYNTYNSTSKARFLGNYTSEVLISLQFVKPSAPGLKPSQVILYCTGASFNLQLPSGKVRTVSLSKYLLIVNM